MMFQIEGRSGVAALRFAKLLVMKRLFVDRCQPGSRRVLRALGRRRNARFAQRQ